MAGMEEPHDERYKEKLARRHSTTSKYATIGSATARRRFWDVPALTVQHDALSADKLSRTVTGLETEHGLPAGTGTMSLDKGRRWEALESLLVDNNDGQSFRYAPDARDRPDRTPHAAVSLEAVGLLDFSPGVDKASQRLHARTLEIQRTYFQWPQEEDLSTPERWAAVSTPQGPRLKLKLKPVYVPPVGPPPEVEACGSENLITSRARLSSPRANMVTPAFARMCVCATVDPRHDHNTHAFMPWVPDGPPGGARTSSAYLEVDLGADTLVTHISTRGRFPNFTAFPDRHACEAWGVRSRGVRPQLKLIDPSREWTTRYEVQTRREGGRQWEALSTFVGNSDALGEVVHSVMGMSRDGRGLRCRYLRFLPLQWHGHRPALRIGVYGKGPTSGGAAADGIASGVPGGGTDGATVATSVHYHIQGAHALQFRPSTDDEEPPARFNRRYSRSQPRNCYDMRYNELQVTAADFPAIRGHNARRTLARTACAPGGPLERELAEGLEVPEAVDEDLEAAGDLPARPLPTLGDAIAFASRSCCRRAPRRPFSRGSSRAALSVATASSAWSIVDPEEGDVASVLSATDDSGWSWTEADAAEDSQSLSSEL